MEEEIIWQRFKSGDRQAFQLMYEKNINALIFYAHRFTNQQELIEDVIQDVFVNLWVKRDGLGNTDAIIKYLCIAVRRELIRRLSGSYNVITATESSLPEVDADFSIEEEIIAQEGDASMSGKLYQAMQQLSNREREAVYLKFYQGMDYEEICEVMEINYQSARNLVSRGILQLKKYLVTIIVLIEHFFY